MQTMFSVKIALRRVEAKGAARKYQHDVGVVLTAALAPVVDVNRRTDQMDACAAFAVDVEGVVDGAASDAAPVADAEVGAVGEIELRRDAKTPANYGHPQ